jgi:hypothetical protein
MADEKESGSRFIVDLGDFKLPPLVEKQVEAEIRATVLRALAESGFGGDLRVPQARVRSPIWDQFPGQTLGLWPGWPQDIPPVVSGPGGGPGDVGSLNVRDHTLIMRAVMEHPMQVLRYLPNKYKVKNGGRPTGAEVLQAASRVEQIDDYTRGRIRIVLEAWPEVEAGLASLPEPVKRGVDDLRQQLANKTVTEKRSLLRDSGLRSRHREDGLADGMEVAARMLEDGQDSIYSEDFSFYKMLPSRAAARDAVSDISSGDTIGATAGGAVGSAAAGVGMAPGAVVGGVFGSGVAVGWHLASWIDSWFD